MIWEVLIEVALDLLSSCWDRGYRSGVRSRVRLRDRKARKAKGRSAKRVAQHQQEV